jgi:hypothetical protein
MRKMNATYHVPADNKVQEKIAEIKAVVGK